MKKSEKLNKLKKDLSAGVKKIADYIRKEAEKSAEIKIGKKKFTFKPIKTIFAVTLLVLVFCIIGFILNMGTNMKTVETEFEAGSAYNAEKASSNGILYNNKGVSLVDDKGKILATIDRAVSQPVVRAEGKYLILADLSGNHYSGVYKNGKTAYDCNTDKDIISAKVTSDGYAAVATDTDGYKACVSVYNNRGNVLYTWNSGSGYVTDVDITENGRYLAAAQLVTDENKCDTRIQFIDTRRGEVIGTAERAGEATAEVKFINDNKLVVITDSHISCYTRSGKQIFDISLEGKTPSLYCLDSEKCLGVVVLDNRGNHMLEIYSYSGKLMGAYTASSEIRALAMHGKTAAVVEQQGIVRVTSRGKAKGVVKIPHDIKDISFFDSDRILAVGSSEAETLNLK